MTVTFQVTPNLTPCIGKAPEPISLRNSIKRITNLKVEAAGSSQSNLFSTQGMNGFMYAIHASFNAHLPLILSPDDVWLAIAQGFSAHVQNHAEELRSMFVAHEGQKYIEIQRDDFVKGAPDNNWMGGFAEFSDKITEHIGTKRDLLVSSFTTTGPVEKAASEIILMDSMKAYFTYGVRTKCGIPKITLLGTIDDWTQIRERARALAEFKCQEWIDALGPVLDEFVRASSGNADPQFWQSLYKYGGGSGGPYVTGAVNVFFPYTKNDRPNHCMATWKDRAGCMLGGPATNMVPSGLSSVPFTWVYYGNKSPMQFIGGFVGTSMDPETLAVRPAIGWGVADRPE